MKRLLSGLIVVATLALIAPLAGQAKGKDDEGLQVRLVLPVNFADPTPDCPGGVVTFGLAWSGKSGTGQNCFAADFAPTATCPADALFCQQAPMLLTLSLPGGVIQADAHLVETWRCGDSACTVLAVDQRWPGTVTDATGRFHDLKGATVSGGGIFAFNATTFELVTFDEVLVIGGDEDDD